MVKHMDTQYGKGWKEADIGFGEIAVTKPTKSELSRKVERELQDMNCACAGMCGLPVTKGI